MAGACGLSRHSIPTGTTHRHPICGVASEYAALAKPFVDQLGSVFGPRYHWGHGTMKRPNGILDLMILPVT